MGMQKITLMTALEPGTLKQCQVRLRTMEQLPAAFVMMLMYLWASKCNIQWPQDS